MGTFAGSPKKHVDGWLKKDTRHLNSKELVHAALSGEPTARQACGPLACHFCARYFGIPMRDYTLNATTLAAWEE
jgi:hypothetical protein